jgi:ATP-binding cassette, subfamily B, bacterial
MTRSNFVGARGRKFLSYYKPYKRILILDVICAFFVSATTLALPLCASYVVKNILEGQAPNALGQIYLVGAAMLGLIALNVVCNQFVDYQGHMMGAKMEGDMRRDLFAQYQKLSFGFFDDQKTGSLMSRITNDLFWMSELCHHAPEDLAIALVKFVGVFAILFSINLELTLILLVFLPVMAAYALYFNQKMEAALEASKERIADVNAQAEDTLSGIRVVQSFTNETLENRKFAFQNERFLDSRNDGYRSEAYFSQGFGAFTQLLSVAVIIFGGVRIANANLGVSDLVTYLLCIGILVDPIQRFVNFTTLYQFGITGFNRFMEIMEITPEIADSSTASEINRARGKLEFKNASFKYTENSDHVLENLSLEIEAGEFVALVGPSGVGKTTLCALIPRFYELTSGEILLDSLNIKDIKLESLRRQVGVVQQEVYLFAGTVADNIRYGKLGASQDEVVEAAKRANAHEFIAALPNGYDTDIGQRGVKLSGGQKQRLSIARVFLKNPPIIIFDEATSALDNHSERAVQESLERLSGNRTTLVIAHRLSTVRNAGRIVVLTEEGIAEQGTHEQLIAKNGVYANLYNTQLKL